LGKNGHLGFFWDLPHPLPLLSPNLTASPNVLVLLGWCQVVHAKGVDDGHVRMFQQKDKELESNSKEKEIEQELIKWNKI